MFSVFISLLSLHWATVFISLYFPAAQFSFYFFHCNEQQFSFHFISLLWATVFISLYFTSMSTVFFSLLSPVMSTVFLSLLSLSVDFFKLISHLRPILRRWNQVSFCDGYSTCHDSRPFHLSVGSTIVGSSPNFISHPFYRRTRTSVSSITEQREWPELTYFSLRRSILAFLF